MKYQIKKLYEHNHFALAHNVFTHSNDHIKNHIHFYIQKQTKRGKTQKSIRKITCFVQVEFHFHFCQFLCAVAPTKSIAFWCA